MQIQIRLITRNRVVIQIGADFTNVDLSWTHLESIDLLDINMTGTNLMKATISKTNFSKVQGLTTVQVKKARNWEEAIYSDEFRRELGLI